MADIITDTHAAEQPPPGPELYIGLEGVQVIFPDGFWDEPSNELTLANGRSMREWRMVSLGQLVTKGLQKAWAARQPSPSGLVGPDGRPLGP